MADNQFASLPVAGKAFIGVFIVGFIGVVFYFTLYSGMQDSIAYADQRHGELLDEQREARQRQQEYIRVTEQLAAREAIDRENKRILPEEAEMAAFLQDLNRVAELSGLEIKLVEPRPEETETLYVRLPVSLSVAGRFHQLAKFFYNISQLRRAINMENIVLSDPTVNEADEVVLTVDVLATTFRRAAVAAAAPANPQAPGAAQ
ncbi:MAG: type 4a pilus biogenesis protein PilO [Myxococcota bacterium]